MAPRKTKKNSKKKTPVFKKTLFWDVDMRAADFEKNAPFIIGRVLDFGDVADYKKIKDYYGLRKIKAVARRHPFPSPKHLPFWELILDLPAGTLSCTRKHLPKALEAFSMN